MAGILTLLSSNSLAVLRAHWRFAFSRAKSDPNAAAYLPELTAYGAQWAQANQTELDREDAVSDADATVVSADAALDALADEVTVVIHGAKKLDVNLPAHQLFFGSETPSQYKKPQLGTQLEKSQGWPALLGQSNMPALLALTAAGAEAVQGGNLAATALDTAITARDAFRLGGERQKAFDAFNSLCSKMYGGLKSFAHDHPELKLPGGYAESFFKGSARSPHDKTVTETADNAAKAQAKATKAQAKHDAALKAAATKQAAVQEHQQKQAVAKTAKKTAKDAAKASKEAAAAAKKKPSKK